MLNALLPVDERVQERPAHTNGRRTERNRLEDIGPSLETAVDVHLQLVKDLRAVRPQLQQHQDARLRSAPPSVTNPHPNDIVKLTHRETGPRDYSTTRRQPHTPRP